MIRRRLHLQIYVTIVASLALTVVLTGFAFTALHDEPRPSEIATSLAHRAVAMALPPDDAPNAEQLAILVEIGTDLDVDLALFDADRQLIGFVGERPPAPPIEETNSLHARTGRSSAMQLPDGRLIVARVPFPAGGSLLALPILPGSVALAIAVASYPLVRRLTGRLERLQASVERMGSGDLGARAPVEGRDEVAGLAASFNHAAERIEHLVDAHRKLLADASHELRTPLSRIRLGVEMFRRTGEAQRLAGVDADINQLDRLIDEILTLSRLDAAPVAMERDIDLLGLAAEECARIGVEVEGQPAFVAGDHELLRRLIRNLVANAQRHGHPPIEVEVTADDATVTLTVRDGGDGIDSAERERVFERFHRGSGKQNVEGYGLGLPLVRQIAQAHGGRAEIAPGRASAVVVRLPRSRGQT